MKKLIYRQGDIDLFKIDKLPKSLKKQSSLVIAEGEATGHNHVLEPIGDSTVTVYADDDVKYIEVIGSAELKHPEHNKDNPMTIVDGIYKM